MERGGIFGSIYCSTDAPTGDSMASITKRGQYQWQARVRRRGYPLQVKTFDTKADAEIWARQIENEIDRGAFICRKEAESTTLREALERYVREITPTKKGATQERNRARRIMLRPIADRFLATIRGVDIAAYRDEMIAANMAAATINNDLILLSHLFTVAVKEWGMESLRNPVALVRRPKLPRGRERRISDTEEAALLEKADRVMKGVIVLALETGMRRGEIAAIRREWIDWQQRFIRLPDTKNGSVRDVPLSSRAIDALRALPVRIDSSLFGVLPDVITKRFERVARRAGIEGLRFHDTRHEATSRLFERGLDVMEVSAITGHKTLGMLQRYTHLKASHLAEKLG